MLTETDYLVFHAWNGYTLGYVRNAVNRRVAEETAYKKWGGLSRVTAGDVPFDWRDRCLDVIGAESC